MTPPFPGLRDGFGVKALLPEDAPLAQTLFEACADYSILENGEPPPPDAARIDFEATPPGRTTDGKVLLGLFNAENRLVGLINADRDWPQAGTWWIGLMLIDPEVRGTAIAADFARGFFAWSEAQNVQQIELAVFEENIRANRFWRSLDFEHIRSTEPRQIGKKTHLLHVMRRTSSAPTG